MIASRPTASLPMYDWPELANEANAFWGYVARSLREAGFDAPDTLTRGDAAFDWTSPNLIFSQTCGYPYATRLAGKVSLIATPHYDVPGCEGPTYSSAVVVRKDSTFQYTSDLRGKRLAANSADSLSGFRCLKPMIGNPPEFFASIAWTSAHRKSAQSVARDEADCAAIDAVCWHLLQQIEPQTADQLRVLDWCPSFPALPFISRLWSSAAEEQVLREAAMGGIRSAVQAGATQAWRLTGLTVLSDKDYQPLVDLRD